MRKLFVLVTFLMLPLMTFAQENKSITERIGAAFKEISDPIVGVVFYHWKFNMPGVEKTIELPIVVLILILGATFFTLYFKGLNFRSFKKCYHTNRGKYEHLEYYVPADEEIKVEGGKIINAVKLTGRKLGEITHFQALSASLSATCGMGNIAGVAVAMAIGGPGAIVWMVLAGFLGMSSKFVECTLGVRYREVDENGNTYGGPMYYLKKGLATKGFAKLGKVLSVFFAIFCVCGSLGGGNMLQSNQAAAQFVTQFNIDIPNARLYFGILITVIVGLVIIGGIKRIGSVTEKLVPFMAITYVGAGLIIVGMNFDMVPFAAGQIWDGAFNADSLLGGVLGVLIVGMTRSAFSNEAGIGSAPIAHSAVKTHFPASEGIAAIIGPFVDTVVVGSTTAIVIIITNAKYNLFSYGSMAGDKVILNATGEKIGGVPLTSVAFDAAIPHFSIVLTIAVILFAISTMISWSYYGLQSWKYLFGKSKASDISFKAMFLLFAIIGSTVTLNTVVAFSDAMIFSMLFPNIVGLIILAPEVKKELKKYFNAIKIHHMPEEIDEAKLRFDDREV